MGFKFTKDQKEQLEEMKKAYSDSKTTYGARKSCLIICSVSFIRQEVWEVGRGALVQFSGILGFRKETGTWRQPEHYTNILAGIIWCMKVLVLEYALPIPKRERLAQSTERTPLERFKIIRDECLVEEEDCPFATLHSLMNYGFILAKDAVGSANISWSHDGEYMYYKGEPFGMTDWKEFISNLIRRAERILARELMFRKDERLPGLNLWLVEDDQMREDVGYYFGRKDMNECDTIRHDMMNWMEEAGDPYGIIGDDNEGNMEFLDVGVDKYNRVDKLFRELLYILVLARSGSPPRVREMTSLRYINSFLGPRNIFVHGGATMLVTDYHKSLAITRTSMV